MCPFFSRSRGSADFALRPEKASASMQAASESPLPQNMAFFWRPSPILLCGLNMDSESACKSTSRSKASMVSTVLRGIRPVISIHMGGQLWFL